MSDTWYDCMDELFKEAIKNTPACDRCNNTEYEGQCRGKAECVKCKKLCDCNLTFCKFCEASINGEKFEHTDDDGYIAGYRYKGETYVTECTPVYTNN